MVLAKLESGCVQRVSREVVELGRCRRSRPIRVTPFSSVLRDSLEGFQHSFFFLFCFVISMKKIAEQQSLRTDAQQEASLAKEELQKSKSTLRQLQDEIEVLSLHRKSGGHLDLYGPA